jgi:hypothetical protein
MYLSNSRLEGGNAASPGTIVLYHARQRSLKKRSLKKEERGFDVPGGTKTGCKKKCTGPRIRSAGNQNLVDNAADKVYKIATIGKRLPASAKPGLFLQAVENCGRMARMFSAVSG